MNYKKFLIFALIILTHFSFGTFVFANEIVPENLRGIAEELGCDTKESCKIAFERDFNRGLALAQRYRVYDNSPEKKKLAESFRKEVLAKLSTVSPEELEVKIVEIASSIIKNKPALAREFGVDQKEVKAAEIVVKEAKDAGVSLSLCSRPANSLTKEDLMICLGISKNLLEKKDVAPILSEDHVQKIQAVTGVVGLQEALDRGEYGELGKTSDELGATCLRPDSSIVCDEIAFKFFGESGVRELTKARKQIEGVRDSYDKVVEKSTLLTPDGQKISGKEAIHSKCDEAFSSRDVALAKACGEFAVKNGSLSREEFEENLRFFQSVADKQNLNFDRCVSDPKSCEGFLRDEHKEEFEISREIEKIMFDEIGFSPKGCATSTGGFSVKKDCIDGAKRAMPKLEDLATKSSIAARMVAEIKTYIESGMEFFEKREELNSQVSKSGGPGGCKSEEECRQYCSKSINGPECLAFGAKAGIFRPEDVAGRFRNYNENIRVDDVSETEIKIDPTLPHPKPEVKDNKILPIEIPEEYQPNLECIRAIQAGDFVRAKGLCAVFKISPMPITPPPIVPINPLPICPALYSVESCPVGQRKVVAYSSPECGIYYGCELDEQEKKPKCPDLPNVDSCPAGEHKVVSYLSSACGIYYNCAPDKKKTICPAMPTVDSCPAGEHKVVSYSSLECGTYYNCAPDEKSKPKDCPQTFTLRECTTGEEPVMKDKECGVYSCQQRVVPVCPNSQYWDGRSCVNSKDSIEECTKSGGIWDVDLRYCRMNNIRDRDSRGCLDSQYWSGTTCVNRTSTTTYSLDPAVGCVDVGGVWDTITNYCKMPVVSSSTTANLINRATTTTTETKGCDTNQWWDSSTRSCRSNSGSENVTIATTTNTNSTSCPRNVFSLLGSGCHDMGEIWMNGDMTKYVFRGVGTTIQNCSNDWVIGCPGPKPLVTSKVTNTTVTTTSTTPTSSQPSASADCARAGGTWSSDNYCHMPNNTSVGSSTGYSSDLATGCVQAGGTWDVTARFCRMPNSNYSSSNSSSASSGQAGCNAVGGNWDSAASYCHMPSTSGSSGSSSASADCARAGGTWSSDNYCHMPNNTSSSCSSGQYWNGSTCVTSPSGGSTTGGGTNYSSDPAIGCAQAGGTWDSSANYCRMPTSLRYSLPNSLLSQLFGAIKGFLGSIK